MSDQNHAKEVGTAGTGNRGGKGVFEPRINKSWCKRCGICISVCPRGVLAFNDERQLFVEKKDDCIGCLMCEKICPDFAIEIFREDEPLTPDANGSDDNSQGGQQ
ncbi:MAG: hypothetical protein CVV64_20000 [Candidatus Wallbacteria bacterium HGW-Wallbacteria-1]|uniref:4Fe-4S ferredoxin-type domain-containing protein n=1 Tax=Candidatus Wallbacteria bacterium HGW-Wallbacteria-1 TaxID=2013854 RepID=A0A2N1PIP1_9BACT|nr:MAG: hypothetical protein CVV64_20000 [Candidatus Wallbacteria bacterium HGW-Wallbacteria-1]